MPPTRAFPPSLSNYSGSSDTVDATDSDDDFATVDEDDDFEWNMRVWQGQAQETQITETAHVRLRWLIRQLSSSLSSSAGAGICDEAAMESSIGSVRSSNSKENDRCGSESIVDKILFQLFGKEVTHAILAAGVPNASGTSSAEHWTHLLTLFDLRRFANKLEETVGMDDALPLLLKSMKVEQQWQKELCADVHEYWNHQIYGDGKNGSINDNLSHNTVPKTWYDLFVLPYNDAAYRILSLFYGIHDEVDSSDSIEQSSVQQAQPTTSSSTTSSTMTRIKTIETPQTKIIQQTPKPTPIKIQNYLLYQASYALQCLQHLVLPSLRNHHQSILKNQLPNQQRLLNEWEVRYHKAFEEWDEYCMNVLGVESDVLPLFPLEIEKKKRNDDVGNERKKECEKECVGGDRGDSVDDAMSGALRDYSKEVENCVIGPMREEFQKLSERFVQSLCNRVVPLSEKGDVRCYGKDIAKAIVYYREFATFVASQRWEPVQQNSSQQCHRVDEMVKSCEMLPTLYHFVTTSVIKKGEDDDTSNIDDDFSPLLFMFTKNPMIRVNLVSDLQLLQSFLSTRKKELSFSPSSHHAHSAYGGGRAIIEAIDMAWAQHCIAQRSSSSSQLSSSNTTELLCLEGISLEEVTKFHAATHNVLLQIVGDGAQAKRLRLLADAVGFPNPNINDCGRFHQLCQQAAHLAWYMTLCHDQREACHQAVQRGLVAIGLAEEELRRMERRIEWIREGLGSVLSTELD